MSPRFLTSFNNWEVEEVRNFLLPIQDKRVLLDLEDKLLMREAKDGRFLVELLYRTLDQPWHKCSCFAVFGISGSPPRWVFFYLGSLLGQIFNSKPIKKEGMSFGQHMLPLQ